MVEESSEDDAEPEAEADEEDPKPNMVLSRASIKSGYEEVYRSWRKLNGFSRLSGVSLLTQCNCFLDCTSRVAEYQVADHGVKNRRVHNGL